MLKTLLSLCLICSLISPAAAQQRTASPGADSRSVISPPAAIGSLQRTGIHKYDEPGLGVAYRYQGQPQVKMDIFIYDYGLKNLGTGIKSPQIKDHFEQVKKEVFLLEKKGRYQSVVKAAEGETALAAPAGKIPALTATFTFIQVGKDTAYSGTRISHVLLLAYKNSFVKVRFTYPQAQKAKGDQAWKQFLADFGNHLK
jgi:hypothetical protein